MHLIRNNSQLCQCPSTVVFAAPRARWHALWALACAGSLASGGYRQLSILFGGGFGLFSLLQVKVETFRALSLAQYVGLLGFAETETLMAADGTRVWTVRLLGSIGTLGTVPWPSRTKHAKNKMMPNSMSNL